MNPCSYSTLATGREGVTARDLLVAERLSRQATVHERLKRGVSDGDLPAETDPVAITEYLLTLLNGMAVQVLGGADGPMLIAVAENGLRALGLKPPVRAAPDAPEKHPLRHRASGPKLKSRRDNSR